MKNFIYLLAGLMLTISCFAQSEYSFQDKYEVTTPFKLKATTNDGDITVKPSENNHVLINYIVKRGNVHVMIDREELENHIDIDILYEKDHVEIMIRQKERELKKQWNKRYYVSLEIYTPVQTATRLFTSDGDVFIKGLNDDQFCQTSDGDIFLTDIKGNVTGHTSDGDVKISNITGETDVTTSDGNIIADNIIGNTKLKTSDGSIKMNEVKGTSTANTSDGDIEAKKVYGESEFKTSDGSIALLGNIGSINARTSDGDIEFNEISGMLVANTSDGDIHGFMTKLDDQLSLHTRDGNVVVTIPANVGLDLQLKGETIDTRLENFSGITEKHQISGQMNGGGILVDISTTDGNITLLYE